MMMIDGQNERRVGIYSYECTFIIPVGPIMPVTPVAPTGPVAPVWP